VGCAGAEDGGDLGAEEAGDDGAMIGEGIAAGLVGVRVVAGGGCALSSTIGRGTGGPGNRSEMDCAEFGAEGIAVA